MADTELSAPKVFTTLDALLAWVAAAPEPSITVTALPSLTTADRRVRDRRTANR